MTLPRSQPQYWLTQVRDHRFAAVLRAVRSAGGTIAGVIPGDTYVVRATPPQRHRIEQAPSVRWMGYYQPAWRVPVAAQGKKALLALPGQRTYRIRVFPTEPSPASVLRSLKAIPGVKVLEDAGVVIDIRARKAQLPAIAAIPAVQWIGIKPRVVPHNVNARWVNDTGVRDLFAATAPGRLTGAGQTAAVADTGLNYTYDLNGRAHIGFRDCNADGTGCKQAIYTSSGSSAAAINLIKDNGTNHRKVVAYFDLGQTGPNMYDESSHGSHTAGSVTGDQPPYNSHTESDGLAPGAMHVHQNIADSGGGLGGLPADDYDLWRQAYRPRNPAAVAETSGLTGNPADYSTEYRPLEDARTHNNSYGLLAPVIDEGSAARLDEFVWDHEDMTIVVSAGNAGPEQFSIGSPSVAKNELSSGASANGRQPMVSIDSMASFSSHGPTGDDRFGVDLATPGQIVVSSKGGSTDEYHVAQGTSMSGPILTGLATLVRQYFYDGYAAAGGDGFAAGAPAAARRHNPSAALVKATLINGAERMRGFYTGDEGNTRTEDGQWPSAGQGFGRVNLDNSLYFTNDPANTWYRDVYRADAEAFPEGAVGASRTYTVEVAPGQPLDVTLAWTDAPALPAGTPGLVNNLDLVVTGPGGSTYVGNNMNSRAMPSVDVAETLNAPLPRDVRNLTERIRVANPAPGTYTISVQATAIAIGHQGFALAASGNISPVGGPTFVPGPPRQRDVAGSPVISDVKVQTISADTARLTFATNEPTTATAVVDIDGVPTTFVDSYNVGLGGFPGLSEGPVETSAEYADKPVVATKHEILITGLDPGQASSVTITARDLAAAANTATRATPLTSPRTVFQADAGDIGQLYEDPQTSAPIAGAAQWRTGTQLYASDPGDGTGILGAFAFRTAGLDPSTITGAVVELTSSHDWVNRYTEDPIYNVDLLAESEVEGSWGSQNYDAIKDASADARVVPETTHKHGAYKKYAFTFACRDLAALRETLANGMAAFRWETQPSAVGFYSMEFGFNRRSRGPSERPKLILFTGQNSYPDGRPCDPATPAPRISKLGIHGGHSSDDVTVTWETDVDSNSLVLFREQGTSAWTQVGTPALTKVHQVEVLGLDPAKQYEFAVRSAACNGATTTDANGGAGYDFYRHSDLGMPTSHSYYDFEASDEGWTVQSSTLSGPDSSWVRTASGANTSANGFHVAIGGNPVGKGYSDEDTTSLISPAQTFSGATAAVRFFMARDTEPAFDFVYVEYSNDGTNWTTAASIDGINDEYPDYEPEAREVQFANPGGNVQVRFRFESDLLLSSPLHLGASVDQVTLLSYPNTSTGPEQLPLVGPVPPPSAGASGLNPPATRTGNANAADIAAGTGMCSIPAPNRAPDAKDDSATTPRNTPVDVNVVANDTDPDGDSLTVTDVTAPKNGTATNNGDGTVTYTPAAGYTGDDEFRYTITDNRGGTDTAKVKVKVTKDTAPPPAGEGDKTSGGGWLADNAGERIKFHFHFKRYAKTGEWKGHLKLYDKPAGVKLEIPHHQLTSMGAVDEPCGSVPEAANSLQFEGTGTFNKQPASFRVCVQDRGDKKTAIHDLFYLECESGCTYDTGTRTPDDEIDYGNIKVERTTPAPGAPAPAPSGASEPSVVTLDDLLVDVGVIGQPHLFTATVYDQYQELLPNATVTLTRTTLGGSVETLTGLTDATGTAVFTVINVATVADYTAHAGAADSNPIELTPSLG